MVTYLNSSNTGYNNIIVLVIDLDVIKILTGYTTCSYYPCHVQTHR